MTAPFWAGVVTMTGIATCGVGVIGLMGAEEEVVDPEHPIAARRRIVATLEEWTHFAGWRFIAGTSWN
jgi:hypothetical protein